MTPASDVVIAEAVRTPVGRRNGGLSTNHPADTLGAVLGAVVDRSGIEPDRVGQLVTGCVSQIGEQAFNVGRTAWLAAGLPLSVAATTVDTQCGSSQQATNVATALVQAGVVDVAVAGGVEAMSRVPIGSNAKGDYGRPIPKSYFARYEFTSQFEEQSASLTGGASPGPMRMSSGFVPRPWPPRPGRRGASTPRSCR